MSRDARFVGYVRESVWHRSSTRGRIVAQRGELERLASGRGLALVGVEEDQLAGRSLRRPGLQRALALCREGRADGIVVTRLDRLTRELDDLAALVTEAQEKGFAIVACDVGLDSRDADAVTLIRVLAEASGWGRRSLAREALPAVDSMTRRSRGRPSSIAPELATRIRGMRAEGLTLQRICDVLNTEGVSTPRGGSEWRPTSLRAVLRKPTTSEE